MPTDGSHLGTGRWAVENELRKLTWGERLLWGTRIRNNLQRPDSRVSRFVPKYGPVAAVQSAAANMWLLPAIPSCFIGVWLLEVAGTSEWLNAIGWFFTAVWIFSMLFALIRMIRAWVAVRRFHDEDG